MRQAMERTLTGGKSVMSEAVQPMHVIGVGIDIIEVSRIARMIDEHGARFLDRVFTQVEQDYANASPVQRAQRLAARFAAKEAVFKALHAPSGSGISWLDIDVHNDAHGVPHATLFGAAATFATQQGLRGLYISIAHVRDFATATAVCEWPDKT